jgi:hypothetical protein
MRAGCLEPAPNPLVMGLPFDNTGGEGEREMAELELALLRRGMDQRAAGRESCSACGRTPLVGERVYTVNDRGHLRCELCHALDGGPALGSRLVHGPAFGQTIRIIDRRAA